MLGGMSGSVYSRPGSETPRCDCSCMRAWWLAKSKFLIPEMIHTGLCVCLGRADFRSPCAEEREQIYSLDLATQMRLNGLEDLFFEDEIDDVKSYDFVYDTCIDAHGGLLNSARRKPIDLRIISDPFGRIPVTRKTQGVMEPPARRQGETLRPPVGPAMVLQAVKKKESYGLATMSSAAFTPVILRTGRLNNVHGMVIGAEGAVSVMHTSMLDSKSHMHVQEGTTHGDKQERFTSDPEQNAGKTPGQAETGHSAVASPQARNDLSHQRAITSSAKRQEQVALDMTSLERRSRQVQAQEEKDGTLHHRDAQKDGTSNFRGPQKEGSFGSKHIHTNDLAGVAAEKVSARNGTEEDWSGAQNSAEERSVVILNDAAYRWIVFFWTFTLNACSRRMLFCAFQSFRSSFFLQRCYSVSFGLFVECLFSLCTCCDARCYGIVAVACGFMADEE